MPPNGGIVRLENVQMKPFFSKGELNAELSVRVPGRTARSNGLPGGHTDLNRRHPGVEKDFAEGVLIIIMFSTSFRPEIINKEVTEDVKWLPGVSEATGVVREEAWGSSSCSKAASPRRAKGQEISMFRWVFHSTQRHS
jgi:hypothetical protein